MSFIFVLYFKKKATCIQIWIGFEFNKIPSIKTFFFLCLNIYFFEYLNLEKKTRRVMI